LNRKFFLLFLLTASILLSGYSQALESSNEPRGVAVILGCYPDGDDTPALMQTARIHAAARLYASGTVDTIVVSGGFTRSHISEARMGKIALAALGVPPDAVVEEDKSASTIENGVFTARLFEQRGWKKQAYLVSQTVHLIRAKPIFEKEGFKIKKVSADIVPADFTYPAAPEPPKDWNNSTIIVYEPYTGEELLEYPAGGLLRRLQAAAAAVRTKPGTRVILFSNWYTRGPIDPSEMMKIALVTLGVIPDNIVADKHHQDAKLDWLRAMYGDKPALLIAPPGAVTPDQAAAWILWEID